MEHAPEGRRTLAAVLASLVLVAALVAAATQRVGAPDPVPTPVAAVAPGTSDAPAPRRGTSAPRPPATGAWLGAWVKPTLPTPDGRLAAFSDYESQLGRRLDLAHTYRRWDDAFPREDDLALAAGGRTVLLSWGGTDTRQIQSGLYDDLIRARAQALKRWGAPVLLEWRWEMDRPNLQGEIWSPADYIAAWKHIRALFDQERVDNVGWVWCPLATGFVDGRAQAYYPGDEQVDWLCADVYPGRTVQPFADAAAPFLAWAREHPLPVVIGEFGMQVALGEQARQEWLAATGAFVRTQPQIKGLVYFDSDSDDPRDPYDMSLRNAPGSLAVFRELAADPYFRTARR